MHPPRAVPILLASCLVASSCTPAPVDPEEQAAVEVVRSFNEAITQKDVDAALASVATGSVQLNLHTSHADMGEETALTQDLDALWRTVGAVLFGTLEAYERTVEALDVAADGDIATVWTETRTVAHSGDGPPTVLEFTEMYVLLRLEDQWKIAAVANNRPVTAP